MNRLRLALLALTPLWPLGCGEGDDPSIPQPLVDRAAPHAAGAGPQQKRITPLRRWVKREPAHSPPPRSGAAFAYDPLLKVSILFGGWTTTGKIIGDIWRYGVTQPAVATPFGSGCPTAAAACSSRLPVS